MTDRQIFDDILYDLTIERSQEDESRLYNRQQMFGFDFGDHQFNNFTFIVLHSEHEKMIKFLIYEMDGKTSPKLHSFKIQKNYFFSVLKKFIRYVFDNGMKRYEPFFPEGFSYDDIK